MSQFKKDIESGLSSSPKTLPSKYFYDKKGDELFVKIMNMPEYYLSRAELEIFKEQGKEIINALDLDPNRYFELIELGAGDGSKTKELLRVLEKEKFNFDYIPIDISQNALDQLQQNLQEELPSISVKKKQGDYFKMMASLYTTKHPKVVLFLGSNIGNMPDAMATDFIYKLGANLRPNDKLFLGVDLIKPENIVLPAYNDATGITKAFNLNLLNRINTELDANFNLDTFTHLAKYSEEEGIALSYLVSNKEQDVSINGTKKTFHFEEVEKIHTEISRKYNDNIIGSILKDTDFKIQDKLLDRKKYFANYILKRV